MIIRSIAGDRGGVGVRAPGSVARPACDQQLSQQHSQRIDVGRLGRLSALDLFGRAIGQRECVAQAKADRSPVRRGQLGADEPDAFAVRDHEHRVGSEVAVKKPIVMKRLERLADTDGDAQRGGHNERTARTEDFTEGGTLGPLERDEELAGVGHVEFVYPLHATENVGRYGERAGLLPHRGHESRVTGKLVPQYLQRDRSAITDVLGGVEDHVAAHRGDGVDPVAGLDNGTSQAQAEFWCRRQLAGSVRRSAASQPECS